jgi:beta-aspartyl-peptidase (threonine type)
MPVAHAARTVIHEVLKPAGGEGGVITMDARGGVALEFNTNAMLRGTIEAGGAARVAIGAEPLAALPGG